MDAYVSNGVPLKSLFKPYLEVQDVSADTSMIIARESAVFSNWIPFRRQIEQVGLVQRRNLVIDVSNAQLVDHSVMEKLEEMQRDFEQEGLSFEVRGLDTLQPRSADSHAARKRGLATVRRVTLMANQSLRYQLLDELQKCGITGYTVTTCSGAGRRHLESDTFADNEHVRIEVIVPEDVCNAIVDYLRRDMLPEHRITACIETVDVVRVGHFAPPLDAPEGNSHA